MAPLAFRTCNPIQCKRDMVLERIDGSGWSSVFTNAERLRAMDALENGRIVVLPQLAFDLRTAERRYLTPTCLLRTSKNISLEGELRGTSLAAPQRDGSAGNVATFFAGSRLPMIAGLCADYSSHLLEGPTSFRPVDIARRKTSWRKDDTRLHVDSFPSRPLRGSRILRLFNNVGESPRVWRLGESFEETARRFTSALAPPLPGSSWFLETLGISKGRRSEYDHCMLNLHDAMKKDTRYQSSADRSEVVFPPGSTWICFTDAGCPCRDFRAIRV